MCSEFHLNRRAGVASWARSSRSGGQIPDDFDLGCYSFKQTAIHRKNIKAEWLRSDPALSPTEGLAYWVLADLHPKGLQRRSGKRGERRKAMETGGLTRVKRKA